MKKIVKWVTVISVGFLMFLYGGASMVSADVILEPKDPFYEEHREECKYSRKTYYANAQQGYVNLYKSPESKVVLDTMQNKTETPILYTYTDKHGSEWGYIETSFSENVKDGAGSGWGRMEDFSFKYDSEEFQKDHASKIFIYEVEFDITKSKEPVILWTYPQSGEKVCEIDPGSEYALEYPKDFYTSYLDDQDRTWVYLSYYLMSRGWICITDPCNTEIPVGEDHSINFYPAAAPAIQKQFHLESIVILVGVILVAGFSAVMIHYIYRKERK